jgi:hypothetical protein
MLVEGAIGNGHGPGGVVEEGILQTRWGVGSSSPEGGRSPINLREMETMGRASMAVETSVMEIV